MAGFLKYFSGFFLIGLTIPTLLILMTWNTLPNEPLYPLKRGLEQIPAMIFGIDPNLLVRYEIKLSDRRYLEAVANAQTGQTEGLKELQNSVSQTALEIKRTSDPRVRISLIASLNQYHQGLQKQKEIIARESPSIVREERSTPANSTTLISLTKPAPTTEPVQQPTTESPASTDDQKTIDTINDTQSQIEQTIKDLEMDAPPEVNKEVPKQESEKQNESEIQKKSGENNGKNQEENQSEHEKEKDKGKGDENDKERTDK